MDPDPLLTISLFVANLIWIQGIVVIFLLICSALISGAEVAFFCLQLKAIEELNENNSDPRLQRVITLLKRPKRLLATILVANNFINIAIVLVFSVLSSFFFSGIENPILVLIIEMGIVIRKNRICNIYKKAEI